MQIRWSRRRTVVCVSSVAGVVFFTYVVCVVDLPLPRRPKTEQILVPNLPRSDSLDYDRFKDPDVDEYDDLDGRQEVTGQTPTSKLKKENDVRVFIRPNSKWERSDICEQNPPMIQTSLESSAGKLTLYVVGKRPPDPQGNGDLIKQMNYELLRAVHNSLAFHANSVMVDVGSRDGSFSILAAKIGRRAVCVWTSASGVPGVCASVRSVNAQRFVTVLQTNSSRTPDPAYRDHVLDIDQEVVCEPGGGGFSLNQLITLDTLEAQAMVVLYLEAFQHDTEALLMCARDFFTHFEVKAILMPWSGHNIKDKMRLAEQISSYKMKPYEFFGVQKELLLRNVEYWPVYVLWKGLGAY